MVADLFEPHRRGEHDAFPLDVVVATLALDLLELVAEVVHGSLVDRGLLSGEAALGSHHRFGWKVGGDLRVGLEPPQNVGLHEAS